MQLARLLIASCALTGFLVAQPSLRITSPADRTTISPGETLTVTVEATPGSQTVLVGSPFGYGDGLKTPPYRFTLHIESNLRPRRYPITAIGFVIPGQAVASDPIFVQVEWPDQPVRLRVETSDTFFKDMKYVDVIGEFADGTSTYLNESTHISFASATPAIARVDKVGYVTLVSPGQATIVVTYGDLQAEVHAFLRAASASHFSAGIPATHTKNIQPRLSARSRREFRSCGTSPVRLA